MKVTKTRVSTTLYDTNGNKISMIKQETVEVDTQTIISHNREESKIIREHIEVYKTDFDNAKKVKDSLLKTRGQKKGGQIFRDMADLIIIVEQPNVPRQTTHIVYGIDYGKGNSKKVDLIWDAAKMANDQFQKPLSKKDKKK